MPVQSRICVGCKRTPRARNSRKCQPCIERACREFEDCQARGVNRCQECGEEYKPDYRKQQTCLICQAHKRVKLALLNTQAAPARARKRG